MYYRYMIYFFFLMMRLPPIVTRTVTLLPYTTLFLSASAAASAGRLCASSAGSPSARCCGTALAVWAVVVVPVDALFGVAPSARTPGCGALVPRSEEHTSELQSLLRISYAVFCLKKKNKSKVILSTLNAYIQYES